jgi:hypothetical protein
MASIITATTTSGLTQSADNSGVLQLASGTGNLVTVPSVTGTAMVSGNMPTFNAYRTGANQSISNNTVTVVACNAEYFDTNSNYNTSDYKFTPTVEGYYQVNFVVGCNGTTVTYCDSRILKNGSLFKTYGLINGSLSGGAFLTGSDVIYMNGTTDYLQIAGYITASSGNAFASESGWSACLVRRA